MTNEMKLITALCDALGLEVDKVCINEDSIRQREAEHNNSLDRLIGGCFGYGGIYPYSSDYVSLLDAIFEYKITKKEDLKQADTKIPKRFIDDNLKKAKGSLMFGIPLENLSKEELMCCVVFSWDESKKARDAANNQNDLDLARSFRGQA